MTNAPTMTPLQALERLETEPDGFDHDGFSYLLDGPQMSPREYWYPCVMGPDGEPWAPVGEPGDPITTETGWIQ